MKSVLIVTQQFMMGGLETHIRGEITQLYENCVQVHLATGRVFDDGLLPSGLFSVSHDIPLDPEITPNEFLTAVNRLRQIIREQSIDCVHVHPFTSIIPAVAAAELEAIPIAVTLHGPDSLASSGPLYDFLIKDVILPKLELIVAVSPEVKRLLSIYAADDSVAVIPNAVPFEDSEDATFGLIEVDPRWLAVSRLDQYKIHGIIDFCIKAKVSGIPGVMIVGDGPAKDDLLQELEKQSLSSYVTLLGASTQIYSLIQRSSGVAGMGRVVLEGLASKKPVVLIGYDGVKGVVDKPLLKLAAEENFSGRGLSTVSADDLSEQLKKIAYSDISEVYAFAKESFNDKDTWAVFLDRLSSVAQTKPSVITGLYYSLSGSPIKGSVPYLHSLEVQDRLETVVCGRNYFDQRLSAAASLCRKRMEGAILNQALGEREGQISILNQALGEREGQISILNQALGEREGQISILNQALGEREGQITRFANEIGGLTSMYEAIRNSRSWRVTSPLRFVARLSRHGLLADDRRWFERKLRSIFRILPFSTSSKMRIKGWYARLFGRPLPDSSAQPVFYRSPESGRQCLPLVDEMTGCDGGDFLTPEHWEHQKKPYGVVVLPIIDWHFRFQRPQQIARRFAMKGHAVAYVSLSFGSELAIAHIEHGIEELRLPGSGSTNVYQEMPSGADIDRLAKALRKYLKANAPHGPWVCIVQLPYWGPVAERLRALVGCPIVYDCMDDHAGFSTNGEQMLAAEAHLLRQADLVVASSDVLFDKVRPLAKSTALIRNAVDYDHFAAVPETPHSPVSNLIVGYYGAIADWFDSTLVAEVARLRPSWRIILIGSTFSGDTGPLTACPNISLLGEKPYTELPQLIADWDCCIIPFKRLPLTEATNPVKIYEMLAAGKPVVSVSLPELLPIADAEHISLSDTASEFVVEIESQVLQDSALRQEARRRYAAENTWEVRQETLDQAISQIYPLVSIVVVTYNNLALNRLCLESLFEDTDYPNYEVIVIDNASSDDTPAYLQSLQYPRLTVILNDENRGFSAANNQGLVRARGEFLCLLNNDTVVTGSWLSTLVRHLQANPDVGLVGPVTNAIGNEAKIPVGYRNLLDLPTWSAAYCLSTSGCLDDITMLAFFCVVMPRSVFERVGLLDDRFGLGMFEDDDYNRRVREAGYLVKVAKDAFIHHWQRASFKLLGEDTYLDTFYENEKKYRTKWAASELSKEDSEKLAGLIAASKASARTIIFAPSIGWNVHLFQRPHHLARVLAQDGFTVVFDCSNAHDDIGLLKEVEPRLFLYKGTADLLAGLHKPVLWTFTYNYDYRDLFPGNIPVIYDWIDDLSVFPYDQILLAQMHSRAMKEATVVASVARRLHESALVERTDAIYLPNAVEEGRFDHPPTPNPALEDKVFSRVVSSGKPIAGYYGALARWFDYELLAQTADLRPDWHFILIGPDHDGSIGQSDLKNHRNITWLGAKDYQALPGYLHLFDVAMIPFKINDITLATSPLKLFEYFAGGKPVVSTPMPECAAFREVYIVGSAEEFAATLDVARTSAKSPEHLSHLAALANENTWRARARKAMEALVNQSVALGGREKTSGAL